MSTDYAFRCYTCRQELHAGQYMGGIYSFGYGSSDAPGRALVAEWAMEHAGEEHDVRLVMSQLDLPDGWTIIHEDEFDGAHMLSPGSFIVCGEKDHRTGRGIYCSDECANKAGES